MAGLVFLFISCLALAAFILIRARNRERAQVLRRLREVSGPGDVALPGTVVAQRSGQGIAPTLDRLFAGSRASSSLQMLIAQSGESVSPGAILATSAALGLGFALVTVMFTPAWYLTPVAALFGGSLPFLRLRHKRKRRIRRFEEQFAEVLELLSRALRAGHAFQTALGMVSTEMKAPASVEFKRAFDEQNFGLPLREALTGISERVPLLDVRFFVTAVLIQRETGGNLSEILDNLASVVRERFKLRRQVRTHSAHGRFTGYVLIGVPIFLGISLTIINPEHMGLLFRERVGLMMLGSAVVLQIIGYFWIRKVINIEV
jgi:tight adherence protein B